MGKAPRSQNTQAQTTLAPRSGNSVMGQAQTAAQSFSGYEEPQYVCWNTRPRGGCTSNFKVFNPGELCMDCQVSGFLMYYPIR